MRGATRTWAVIVGSSVGWMAHSLISLLIWWLATWILNFAGYNEQQAYVSLVRSVGFLSALHLFGFVGMFLVGYLVIALDPLRSSRLPLFAAVAISLVSLVLSITPYPSQLPAWSIWLSVLLPLLGVPTGSAFFLRKNTSAPEVVATKDSPVFSFKAAFRAERSILLVVMNIFGLLFALVVTATYFFLCRQSGCDFVGDRPEVTFLFLLFGCTHMLAACTALLASFGRLSRRWVLPGLMMASGVALLESTFFIGGIAWLWRMLVQEDSVTAFGVVFSLGLTLLPLAAIWNAVALARCIVLERPMANSAELV